MGRTKVLIADDHEVVRKGIRAILQSERNIRVIGEAETVSKMLMQAKTTKPDLVLMDLVMPEVNGLETIRQMRANAPATRIIVLTMHESLVLVRKVLEAGADGYVLKTELATDIKAAVKAVSRGDRYLSCKVAEALLAHDARESTPGKDMSPLTAREHEVIRLLSTGKSNKEIASELGISVRTVETHRANIMRKLNLHSVTELLHYIFSNKLVTSGIENPT